MGGSDPLWTSLDINFWQAIIIAVIAITYFYIFKVSILSTFLFLLGLLIISILFGHSKFIGQNETEYWIATAIIGVICIISYLENES